MTEGKGVRNDIRKNDPENVFSGFPIKSGTRRGKEGMKALDSSLRWNDRALINLAVAFHREC